MKTDLAFIVLIVVMIGIPVAGLIVILAPIWDQAWN